MKRILLILSLIMLFSCADKKEIKLTAEVSCGQCQFEMTLQKGCNLAVKIDGESYFVDGFDIDDFGDAHNKHTGFCELIRKAEVSGTIVNNRFIATSIVLVD